MYVCMCVAICMYVLMYVWTYVCLHIVPYVIIMYVKHIAMLVCCNNNDVSVLDYL